MRSWFFYAYRGECFEFDVPFVVPRHVYHSL